METKIPPPITTLLFAIAMWIADGWVPFGRINIPGDGILFLAFVLAGIAIMISANISFRKARTTVNPLNPSKASTMVDSGVFRHTRNPMYLGMLLILIGWFFSLENVVAGLLLPVFVGYMNRFQIGPEERALKKVFGQPYQDYLGRVRRWI